MRDLFRMLESFNTAFRLKITFVKMQNTSTNLKRFFFTKKETILIACLKISDILKKIRLKFGMTT